VTAVRPLPRTGSIFFDARGDDRALRVSWHEEADLVVVSLWRDNVCTGSFRLAGADIPDAIDTLVNALRQRTATQARPPLGDVG
jgi:hypothetical protein